MELWTDIYHRARKELVVAEQRTQKQRPHISAITMLRSSPNTLASALFDGTVQLVDFQSQKIKQVFDAHKGRVWSVVELKPELIASSGDDKAIKIWDCRQKKSICTLNDNPGRVSSLLKIDEDQFISGSCPSDPFASKEKAEIKIWDIKKL
jgi:WD40 repeat protein